MSDMRDPGAEVRMDANEGDRQETLQMLAAIARADLAVLGDDYFATFTDHPEDRTISVHCEKKWWLRE